MINLNYEKQNFKSGQVLTADELNYMEDGIAAAVSTEAQTLTDEQKQQARANIGAVGNGEPINMNGSHLNHVKQIIFNGMVVETMVAVANNNTKDANGNAVLEFRDIPDNKPIALRGIAPGTEATDAVNKAQLDDAIKMSGFYDIEEVTYINSSESDAASNLSWAFTFPEKLKTVTVTPVFSTEDTTKTYQVDVYKARASIATGVAYDLVETVGAFNVGDSFTLNDVDVDTVVAIVTPSDFVLKFSHNTKGTHQYEAKLLYLRNNTITVTDYFFGGTFVISTTVSKLEQIQMTVLPTEPKDGQIIQWVGATDATYTNGYFYQYNGTTWEQKNTQPQPDIEGGCAVESVNGKNGAVVLTGDDLNCPVMDDIYKTTDPEAVTNTNIGTDALTINNSGFWLPNRAVSATIKPEFSANSSGTYTVKKYRSIGNRRVGASYEFVEDVATDVSVTEGFTVYNVGLSDFFIFDLSKANGKLMLTNETTKPQNKTYDVPLVWIASNKINSNKTFAGTFTVSSPEYKFLTMPEVSNHFALMGKKIAFFGDSRTWYDQHNYGAYTKPELAGTPCRGYQQEVAKITGCQYVSYASSGWNTPQICKEYIIGKTAYSDCDILVIDGGINDSNYVSVGTVQPIGSAFDTSTTSGALQAAIEDVLYRYPEKQIYLTTPFVGWRNDDFIDSDKVVASAKKQIAALYNLPCFDAREIVPFNIINRDLYYCDKDEFAANTSPTWSKYEFYEKAGTDEYNLLTVKPSNWDTNYADYYKKTTVFLHLNDKGNVVFGRALAKFLMAN